MPTCSGSGFLFNIPMFVERKFVIEKITSTQGLLSTVWFPWRQPQKAHVRYLHAFLHHDQNRWTRNPASKDTPGKPYQTEYLSHKLPSIDMWKCHHVVVSRRSLTKTLTWTSISTNVHICDLPRLRRMHRWRTAWNSWIGLARALVCGRVEEHVHLKGIRLTYLTLKRSTCCMKLNDVLLLIFSFKHFSGHAFQVAYPECKSHTVIENMAGSPFCKGVSLSSAKLTAYVVGAEGNTFGLDFCEFKLCVWISHQDPLGNNHFVWSLYSTYVPQNSVANSVPRSVPLAGGIIGIPSHGVLLPTN